MNTWVKDKLNYVYIAKNYPDDQFNYACALYIARLVSPLEMVENVLKSESSKKKLRFI